MPDLAALAQTARELTEQIQLLQRQQATRAAAEEERDQMEQIVSIAKRHSIRGHVLEKMDEHQRGLYTTALCSIVNKSSNLEARTGRLVYIGRLLASCGREALLNEGLTRSLRLDAQFIADFVEQIRDSHREAFTVDAVVLCHLAGETEDTMLKAAAEYISLLELKDEAVGRCARLATAILAQSAEQFWAVPGADLYIGYMSGWRDCVTAEDLPSVKDRKGTLVFVRHSKPSWMSGWSWTNTRRSTLCSSTALSWAAPLSGRRRRRWTASTACLMGVRWTIKQRQRKKTLTIGGDIGMYPNRFSFCHLEPSCIANFGIIIECFRITGEGGTILTTSLISFQLLL